MGVFREKVTGHSIVKYFEQTGTARSSVQLEVYHRFQVVSYVRPIQEIPEKIHKE